MTFWYIVIGILGIYTLTQLFGGGINAAKQEIKSFAMPNIKPILVIGGILFLLYLANGGAGSLYQNSKEQVRACVQTCTTQELLEQKKKAEQDKKDADYADRIYDTVAKELNK